MQSIDRFANFSKVFVASFYVLNQGPLLVKSSSSLTIAFKNVFLEATTFFFGVDNPLFRVNKTEETIKARKEYKIVVSFDGNAGKSKLPILGKLVVSCPKTVCGESSILWVYYLRGVFVEAKESKEGREKDNRSPSSINRSASTIAR